MTVELRLPSYVPGAQFTATVTGAWTSADDISNLQGDAMALDALARRASEVTSRYLVPYASTAELAVNAFLGTALTCNAVVTSLGRVALSSSPGDQQITDDYLAVQREEQARLARVAKRLRSLRDMLSEPGLAQLWWADRNPELLPYLTNGAFAAVTSALPQSPTSTPDTYSSILSDYLSSLTDEDHRYALTVFEHALEKIGSPAELSRLRQLRESDSTDEDARVASERSKVHYGEHSSS